MTSVWYCTREDVKAAIDSAETARNNAQIDRAIEAASRAIERPEMCGRKFYPTTDTRDFTWPDQGYGSVDTLFLGEDELLSVTSITTEGTAISASDYDLEPARSGPPYSRLVLDREALADGTVEFEVGDSGKGTIQIVGDYGGNNDTATAGALAEALDASETSVDVTDSTIIGVGQLIIVDTERMVVTGKSMLTTGQTLQAALTASTSDVTVSVTDGTAFAVGETILLDSERMLIVDIAGNDLTVKRAWDGSVLAAHTAPTIYAPRTLTVERGVLGSTAATHTTSTAVTKLVVPPLVRQLCIAEALTGILQEGAGYARVVGSGDNEREASGRGLLDLRKQVIEAHGRGLLV